MLWRLFKSELSIDEALEFPTISYDLSPSELSHRVNKEKAPVAANRNSRLWIEDWSERDEERLRDPNITFGICWSNTKKRQNF